MADSLFQILNISQQDMLARLLDLDVTSNNIANINTVGYKQNRANFQELLQQKQQSGVYLQPTQLLTYQGSLVQTTNPLDLSISGEGFFQVKLPDGRTAYTRNGQFSLDSNHKIVSPDGYPLVWQGQIPATSEEVQVQPDGTVYSRTGTQWTQAGTIQIATFLNPTALEINGSNTYLATPASGAAKTGAPGSATYGQIKSSSVEQSNVNLATEMTHMMALQRSFQISSKTFQQTDTMISEAILMRR
jgi:flagellar basal-body rod protein FlgG